ncbi:F-box domain [Macleaya cordata]|uniref:F-box domain n=1 Tax=Macleaya cordata TaxID=56857 RepID=A0A200PTU2_MACCD|nr:F-box domain [Macleaya cordata]
MNKKRKKEEEKEKPAMRSLSQSASSTGVVLPQEVIYEILTRVPLKHLLSRCRLVCKGWRSLTYDSEFKLVHSQRTPTISGYLIQLSSRDEELFHFVSFIHQSPLIPSPSLDFLPRHVEILSSSSPHGLLCCVSYNLQTGYTFYLCKPATREWLKIPSPKTKQYLTLQTALVVKGCNPLHYKIIRFSTSPGYLVYHCEIFNSNYWEWKMLNDIIVCHDGEFKPYSFIGSATDPGVLVHGAIHWLSYHGQISALDVNIDNGSWRIISPPIDDGKLNEKGFSVEKKLVECEGEIGLLYLALDEKWLELWVLENYHLKDETRWNKIYRVDLKPVHLGLFGSGKKLLDLYTKHIVLMKIGDEIIWYDCKTGSRTVALKVPDECSVLKVHQIHSDLVPFL